MSVVAKSLLGFPEALGLVAARASDAGLVAARASDVDRVRPTAAAAGIAAAGAAAPLFGVSAGADAR